MTPTVFDIFEETPYIFLQLGKGGILGDTIVKRTSATGVFKERDGQTQFNQNMATADSDATLHVRPSEPFVKTIDRNLVGHGIKHQNQDYRIIGQTTGRNFDNNNIEFYRLTLKRESLASYGSDSSN